MIKQLNNKIEVDAETVYISYLISSLFIIDSIFYGLQKDLLNFVLYFTLIMLSGYALFLIILEISIEIDKKLKEYGLFK
jgi:hypothetical protein